MNDLRNINPILLIMKKIILVAAMVLGFTVAAVAQPRAIGGRIGNGAEVSYQHQLGTNFLEIDGGAGLDIYNADGIAPTVGATAIYNFMIAQPNWTDRGEWGFYAGPGAGVGMGFGKNSYFNVSAAGMVGLEYTFWFPLQLSVDFRQHIGVGFGGHGIYHPSSIGISARYRF